MKKILFALILSVGFFATSARAEDGLRVGVMDVMKISMDANESRMDIGIKILCPNI